ncbi:2,3-butanediol dehydrogenase [soil metagenome]
MFALRLHGPGDARLDEIPEPTLGTHDVKIRIAWAGICGSDLRAYANGPANPADFAHPLFGEHGPHTIGHEFSGTVVKVGSDVSDVAPGDLVAVRPNLWDGTCPACLRGEVNLCENWGFVGIHGKGGGFSEIVVADRDTVHVLPAGVSLESGALVESLTVAWHAVKRAHVGAGSVVLIVGAGPIGLAILLCVRAAGASRVFMSEPSAQRAALATQLGAEVIDPRTDDVAAYVMAHHGDGVDASFDASGFDASTFQTALDGLRKGGHMVAVARLHDPFAFDSGVLMFTEKSVTGSFGYDDEDFSEVIAAIADGSLDPSPLVSSRIGLSDAVKFGFDHLLGEGRNSEVKILVSPDSPVESE